MQGFSEHLSYTANRSAIPKGGASSNMMLYEEQKRDRIIRQ